MVERSDAPHRRKKVPAVLLVASIAATLIGLGASPAAASAVDAGCATVDAVFARGSGQTVAESGREAERFRAEIQRRVDSVSYYELGTEEIEGDQYPAVPVGGSHPINSGGAFITSGGALTYGNSVNEGVDELTKYIRARIALCGDETLFILGGYSQGAQVVGETYNERLTDAERDHVVFNALFGDPKLYLPEGESEWHRDEGAWVPEYVAPFCDGEREKSTWRRTVPDCNTDNGSLGARVPYVPASWSTSTGLWCNDDDFVCGSSKNPFTVSGHVYSDVGGAIDDGVLEAVEKLAVRLGSSDELDTVFVPVRAGRTGLDVVFLIDSTGSMSGQIDQAKQFAGSMSASIAAVNGRVALVEYRDAGDEFTARVLTGLQEDTTEFQSKLDGISVGGGGDTPEAALHALMTGFDGLDWRPGATKAAVILTDAGFHNPDLVDGSTVESVAARSLEIDPVNVYPVVSEYNAAEYEELATATSGEVIINSGDAGTALEEALITITERPVAQLGLNEYFADTGTPVYFDASTSYGVSSPIATFDWDFDGDGVFEILGGASAVEYAYPTTGDYFIQVRVTDEDGGIGTHAVPVHIGTDTGKPVLPEPAQSISVAVAADEATVVWDAEVEPTGYWSISVDGVEIGRFAPDARDGRVGDLLAGTEYVFGVRPVSSEPIVGDEITTTATLAPAATAPTVSGIPAAGIVGSPYSFAYTLTGLPAPGLSLLSGTLPPGLTLSTAGVLAGTPTQAGTYAFVVQATNAAGSVQQANSIVVSAKSATKADLKVEIAAPSSATLGKDFTYTITTANAGRAAAKSIVTTIVLPAGVTVVSTSGKPTQVGQTVTFSTSTLAAGGTSTAKITVKATEKGMRTALAATLSTRTPDSALRNNADRATTKVG
ncbi:cutinase family protein [Rathayibacter sp. AY1C1]|uniref:cutinase family protein n=1 Tax=Rathayibacter sp. AY1C1 TaxID=2080534 RepID=UPI0015E2975C|nr:cutinase family protein [Rathayibacter sp. AY1C1]